MKVIGIRRKRLTIDFMIKCDMKNFSSTMTIAQQDHLVTEQWADRSRGKLLVKMPF